MKGGERWRKRRERCRPGVRLINPYIAQRKNAKDFVSYTNRASNKLGSQHAGMRARIQRTREARKCTIGKQTISTLRNINHNGKTYSVGTAEPRKETGREWEQRRGREESERKGGTRDDLFGGMRDLVRFPKCFGYFSCIFHVPFFLFLCFCDCLVLFSFSGDLVVQNCFQAHWLTELRRHFLLVWSTGTNTHSMEAVQFPSFLGTMTAFERHQIGDNFNNICGGDLVFFSLHCHGGFIGRRMCEGKRTKKKRQSAGDRSDWRLSMFSSQRHKWQTKQKPCMLTNVSNYKKSKNILGTAMRTNSDRYGHDRFGEIFREQKTKQKMNE